MSAGKLSLLASLLAVCACAAESSAPTRPDEPGDEAEEAEQPAATVAAGRDTSVTSCFAACQNATLSCAEGAAGAPREAFLEIGETGCTGEIAVNGGTAPLRVDCSKRQACVGDTCADATFSATSLAWGKTVCTRTIL